jgi:putative colanic acid biosynthesis UDP-glucose lipid carrier transferase
LIGPPAKVRRVRRWLKVVEDYGVEAVGLVTDSKQKSSFGIPVVGTPGDLPAILRSHSIHSVLLLEIPTNQSDLSGIVEACESAGTRLSAVNTLADSFMHSLRYFQHFGIDFVSLREEPLEDPLSRIAKRVVDIAISLPVVGLILPPLALFTAILHRVQSPGPLFYRQTRTGIRNERFEILKFRSMIATPGDEARQATEHDERLFPGARFLRRSSIDEFPQFLNVLRGDMSLVGPRPHMLEHDEKFAAIFRSYHVRSYVKPGLTGLAQIRGYRGEAKSDVDIKNRIECDIDYIERWSLILDLLIIVKTVWQIPFPPKTAY